MSNKNEPAPWQQGSMKTPVNKTSKKTLMQTTHTKTPEQGDKGTIGNEPLYKGDLSSEEVERRFNKESTPTEDNAPQKKPEPNTKRLGTFYNQCSYEIPSKLPQSMCDVMSDYFGNLDSQRPQSDDIKNVDVTWGNHNDWVGPFLYQYIAQANEHLFQYDITGLYFNELCHISMNEGSEYQWHSDSNDTNYLAFEPPHSRSYLNYPKTEYVRKLSFVLQLSDGDDYEGGDVKLRLNTPNENVIHMNRDRGVMAVFDSRTRQCVEPVTKGTRKAVVGWAIGPRWK